MVFIKKPFTVDKVFHEETPKFFIRRLFADDSVTAQDPSGVGINDKDWFPETIEQDAIRRLGTDPFNAEEHFP